MKIGMVGLQIAPSRKDTFVGGYVVSVKRLSTQLTARGHQVHILSTPPPRKALADSHFNQIFATQDNKNEMNACTLNLPWASIQLVNITAPYPTIGYGLEFAMKSLIRMRSLNNHQNFQIIHGHSGHPSLATLTGIIARTIRVPAIHSLYCPLKQKHPDKGAKRIFSAPSLARHYFSNVDMIIAISENVKRSLTQAGIGAENIRIVPPLIDLAQFNPEVSGAESRAKLGFNENDFVILFVGNLTENKGLDILLVAIGRLICHHSNLKLLMTIDFLRPRHERRIAKIKATIESESLDENVIQLGIVTDMAELMAACDLLIAPFLSTVGVLDYPLPILEAMAVGKPVIATEVGGIPEIVKHKENGMLVEPNNVNELVNAIMYMLNNKEEAKNMGEEGAKIISEKFRSEIVIDKLERIYEGVIQNYSGNRRY